MKFDAQTLLLLLTLCLYLIGGCLIKEDRDSLHVEQFVYTDSDGEEHEEECLIEINGIGKVLSYSDLYFSTLPFLIFSCILARVIFNSTDEIRSMIYTNCVLGLLLIWLTTKNTAISTIFYWGGIITASFIPYKKEGKYEER